MKFRRQRLRLTPSICARCRPLAGLVRMASSPKVVARICAPLSIDTEPPVKIGRMTRSTSKVVFKGCFVAIAKAAHGLSRACKCLAVVMRAGRDFF